MQFNMMIVDDEAPIRKGLTHFIDWAAIDCVVADTAGDGMEAQKKLAEQEFHIVITDIRMPEADGIALSKFICENYPEIKVILLSGYADFEYARSAIQYRVIEFLLKPTAKDKLIHAVQNAKKLIVEEREKNLAEGEEHVLLREQLLTELTEGAPDSALLKRLEYYRLTIDRYYIAAFQIFPQTSDLPAFKKLLQEQSPAGFCYRYNHLVLMLYPAEGDCSRTAALEELKKSSLEMVQIAGELYALDIAAGISACHEGAVSYRKAVAEAVQALAVNFYHDGSIACYTPGKEAESYTLTTEDTLELYHFEKALNTWDFARAESILKALFVKLKTNLARVEDMKHICSNIYYICSHILIKEDMPPLPWDILQTVRESADMFRLEKQVFSMLSAVSSALTENGQQYGSIVSKAMQHIHANLSGKLSLEVVAGQIHVNPSHLSRTFKREYGESITEYINRSRIKMAQELLLGKDTLLYEVAEMTGFQDSAYFSATFKKYTGCSPKEWKNSRGGAAIPPPDQTQE